MVFIGRYYQGIGILISYLVNRARSAIKVIQYHLIDNKDTPKKVGETFLGLMIVTFYCTETTCIYGAAWLR